MQDANQRHATTSASALSMDYDENRSVSEINSITCKDDIYTDIGTYNRIRMQKLSQFKSVISVNKHHHAPRVPTWKRANASTLVRNSINDVSPCESWYTYNSEVSHVETPSATAETPVTIFFG